MIIFTYFTAIVAVIEGTLELQYYTNIFKFICLIGLVIFTVFATVMYFHFVEEALFPSVNKQKLIVTRVLAVLGFTSMSMAICTIIPIIIFSATESIIQITPDELSLNVISVAMSNIIILSPIASMIGFIGFASMRIGFKTQSVSVPIFAALIFVAFTGDILANAYDNLLIRFLMLLFVVFIGLLTLHTLIKKSSN